MQKVYVFWSGWMEAAIVKAEEDRTGARVPAKYKGRGTLPRFQLADQFRPAPKQPRNGEDDSFGVAGHGESLHTKQARRLTQLLSME